MSNLRRLAQRLLPLIDLAAPADADEQAVLALCREASTPAGPVVAVRVLPEFVAPSKRTLRGRGVAVAALVASAAEFGEDAKVPVAWLVAANDSYFPPDLSKQMADAFRKGGDKVDFRVLPAFRSEGRMRVLHTRHELLGMFTHGRRLRCDVHRLRHRCRCMHHLTRPALARVHVHAAWQARIE